MQGRRKVREGGSEIIARIGRESVVMLNEVGIKRSRVYRGLVLVGAALNMRGCYGHQPCLL